MESKFCETIRSKNTVRAEKILRDNPDIDVNWQDAAQYRQTALHNACFSRLDSILPTLLAHPGIDVNLKSSYRETPLLVACANGSAECVRLLLEDPRVALNVVDRHGWSALRGPAYHGRLGVFKWWIASGREMDLGTPGDWETDVIGATEWSRTTEVAELLKRFRKDPDGVRHDVRVELGVLGVLATKLFALGVFVSDGLLRVSQGDQSTTAPAARFFHVVTQLPLELQMVLCYRVLGSAREIILGKDSEVAFRELARRYSPPRSAPLTFRLIKASKEGNAAEVRDLLASNPGLPCNWNQTEEGCTALHLACKYGHQEVVRVLLEDPRISVNRQMMGGLTPFSLACRSQQYSCARLLLRDPRCRTHLPETGGLTPLHHACIEGDAFVVSLVLAHSSDAVINLKNERGFNPFHLACLAHERWPAKSAFCARLFLRDSRTAINEPARNGSTPLMTVTSHGHGPEIIEWWVASGREINLSHLENEGAPERSKDVATATLLGRYEDNPVKTREEVRRRLDWYNKAAAAVFALTVCVSDALLEIRSGEKANNAGRFFLIAKELGLELQMALCHCVAGSAKKTIPIMVAEEAFKELTERI